MYKVIYISITHSPADNYNCACVFFTSNTHLKLKISQFEKKRVSVLLPRKICEYFVYKSSSYCESLEDAINSSGDNVIVLDGSQLYYEKCLKNADKEAYEAYEEAKKAYGPCLDNGLKLDDLIADLIKANSSGNFNEVAKLKCDEALHSRSCLYAYYDKIENCLSKTEQDNMLTLRSLGNKVIELTCNKEGSLLSEFVARGGMECSATNENKLWNCFKDTVMGLLMKYARERKTIAYEFDNDGCNQISALRNCWVNTMKTCSDPQLTKITDDLFKSALEVTPCRADEE